MMVVVVSALRALRPDVGHPGLTITQVFSILQGRAGATSCRQGEAPRYLLIELPRQLVLRPEHKEQQVLMRTHAKLVFTALVATVFMGLAVGSATAGRLSTSNRNFRATWAAIRMFDEEGVAEITCAVTFEGSFHSATINKVNGALIGAVSRAIVKSNSCIGGNATLLQAALPWHITYEGFRGTLPNIGSVEFLIKRYAWQVEVTVIFIRVLCLYSDHGSAEENLMGIASRSTATGDITTDTSETNRRAGFTSGNESCPPFTRIEGTGQVFLLGNTARIRITLI